MSTVQDKLRWRDVRIIRRNKNYTQKEFGPMLGMSQSALSIQERDCADEYVDDEQARAVLEAPMNAKKVGARVGILFEGVVAYLTASRRLPPGTRKLVELRPVQRLPPNCKMLPIFVAVGDDSSLPSAPDADGEPRVGSPPGASSAATPVDPSGQALMSALSALASLARTVRFAIMIGGMAMLGSCLMRATAPERAEELHTPVPMPNQMCTENDNDNESIPMPSEPYPWQKRAPCSLKKGESEKRGGCWIVTGSPPPCPESAVESEGRCFIPAPARLKRPSSTNPKKQ